MVTFPNAVEMPHDDFTVPPTGIVLTRADTGPDGIRAVLVHGECFGAEITWFEETECTVIVTDTGSGGPVLSMRHDGYTTTHTYQGLEQEGSTWWRYAHEVDPNEYREHCLRIVRKA